MGTFACRIAFALLLCWAATISSAQQAPAPANREVKPAAEGPSQLDRPVSRPKNGVKHPDLDEAWEKYEEAVQKASEDVTAAITTQVDKARDKGDLPLVLQLQAALTGFNESGELPTLSQLKTRANAAAAAYRKANDELLKAYDAVSTALTKQKDVDINEPKKVQAEKKSLVGQRPNQQQPVLKNKVFEWSSTVKGWTGSTNHNNIFVVPIPRRMRGKCTVVFRLSAASTDTNGRVTLTPPQGLPHPLAAWSAKDNLPLSHNSRNDIATGTPADHTIGKEWSVTLPQNPVDLMPGDYTLEFKYTNGRSHTIIESVSFVVE